MPPTNGLPVPAIDPDFKKLLRSLTVDERNALEESLCGEEGCREALIVARGPWLSPAQQAGILVDGHNRMELCDRHGLEYRITEIEFRRRADAVAWIVANQLARRNLTQAEASILRAAHYNAEVKEPHRPTNESRKSLPDKDGKGCKVCTLKTAERVAQAQGVSTRTIHNDVKFATAVETIGAKSPEVKQSILSGEIPKADVPALASASRKDLDKVAKAPAGEKKKAAKQVAKKASEPAKSEEAPLSVEERMAAHNSALESLARQVAIACLHAVDEYAAGGIGGPWIDPQTRETIRSQLASAAGTIRAQKGSAICGYCHGKTPEKCKHCRGTGWLTKTRAAGVPDQLKG
jgi:hypothetical protein